MRNASRCFNRFRVAALIIHELGTDGHLERELVSVHGAIFRTVALRLSVLRAASRPSSSLPATFSRHRREKGEVFKCDNSAAGARESLAMNQWSPHSLHLVCLFHPGPGWHGDTDGFEGFIAIAAELEVSAHRN